MSDDTAPPRASQPTGACLFDGQPAVHLRSPAGAQATVLLHGAHVVSWIPALGEEQLYLSPTSALGGTAAVRGGVPVIFPQFNQQGPLPKHGFARNRAWALQEATVRGEHAFAVLRLDADEATRAIWPHGFALEMTVSVDARRLEMELAVINTGDSTIDFQAALHTYLRCGDVGRAQLEGLQGVNYQDAVLDQPRLTRIFDDLGAQIAGDDLCTGTRRYLGQVGNSGDSLADLAQHIMQRSPCPCKRQASQDASQVLLEQVQRAHATGLVFLLPKYCEPQAFQYALLRPALEKAGVPCLALDVEQVPSIEALTTRVQAFTEIL